MPEPEQTARQPPPPLPALPSPSSPPSPSPAPPPNRLRPAQLPHSILQAHDLNPHMNELPHSPLRAESPLHSDEPDRTTSLSSKASGGVIASIEKYYSPLNSPLPASPPKTSADNHSNNNVNSSSHIINFSRSGATPPASLTEKNLGGGEGGGERGKDRKRKGVRFGAVEEIVERSRRVNVIQRVALGLRVCEFLLCLISFSVMASDKTQGWSGDSFDRYKEYRFCLSVNVIAFIYSGFQAFDLAYHLVTGKHVVSHHLRHQFDFVMDQVLAYLLVSASSAAATRVVDWQLNWGKDEFTEKASASVSLSFLAFIAFAISSLISGHNVCNHEFT
ncbi:hypothetical protein Dimus_004777 [Dionaea muscipula]